MAVNVEPKPTAAFAISLLSGVLILVGSFLFSAIAILYIPVFSGSMLLTMGVITALVTLVGSWLLYNNAAQRKIGSVLVLVFSVISMNVIGIVLGLIGGFLGITYKGSTTNTGTSSSSRGYNPP